MGILDTLDLMALGEARGLSYAVTPEGRLRVEGPESQAELAAVIGERRFEVVHLLCDSGELPRMAGHCADCGEQWDDLISGLCFRCGELRKFLNNDLPCECPSGPRWRNRDGGFYWRCSVCQPAPADAVWSRGQAQQARVLKFESARLGL